MRLLLIPLTRVADFPCARDPRGDTLRDRGLILDPAAHDC